LASTCLGRAPIGWYKTTIREDHALYPFPEEMMKDGLEFGNLIDT
jgi:hypothetical protein